MHFEHTGGTITPFHGDDSAEHESAGNGRISGNGNGHGSHHVSGQIAALLAENQELRCELERLRTDRARMTDILNRLMEALGTTSAERIVHDVRNVLNERELYRALADASM